MKWRVIAELTGSAWTQQSCHQPPNRRDRRMPAEPFEQRSGISRVHAKPVVGARAQQFDQRRPHLVNRSGLVDANKAPPFEQTHAFVEFHPAGQFVALSRAPPREFRMLARTNEMYRFER